MVQRVVRQHPPRYCDAISDRNHAGCLRTRKSTGCTVLKHGSHMIKMRSATQNPLGLWSGESELYAAVKGASVGMGIEALMRDLRQAVVKPLRLSVDSAACLGMAGRQGAGRVRHIHTPALWLQQAVKEGRVTLHKMPGSENPADLGTKPLGKASIMKILQMLGFVVMEGKSRLALKAAV